MYDRDAASARKPELSLHVRFGSRADIAAPPINVRFTPKADRSTIGKASYCPFYFDRLCQPDARFFNLHRIYWRQTFRNLLGIRTVRVKEIAMGASQSR